jgi:hypothetical protein
MNIQYTLTMNNNIEWRAGQDERNVIILLLLLSFSPDLHIITHRWFYKVVKPKACSSLCIITLRGPFRNKIIHFIWGMLYFTMNSSYRH